MDNMLMKSHVYIMPVLAAILALSGCSSDKGGMPGKYRSIDSVSYWFLPYNADYSNWIDVRALMINARRAVEVQPDVLLEFSNGMNSIYELDSGCIGDLRGMMWIHLAGRTDTVLVDRGGRLHIGDKCYESNRRVLSHFDFYLGPKDGGGMRRITPSTLEKWRNTGVFD